jgi:hypothetical protein
MKMLNITGETGPGLLHSLSQVKPRDHNGSHEPA